MKGKKILLLSLFALALFSVAFLLSDSSENKVVVDSQKQSATVNLAGEVGGLEAPADLQVSY